MKISLLADCPHEINKIAKWYYDEWVHLFPNMTEEGVRKGLTETSIHRNEIPLELVIHENDELVGVAQLVYRENPKYPEYEHWLGGVVGAPEKRGSGMGNVLIREAKNKTVSLGVKALYLQCESPYVTLYKKYGFQELHAPNHSDQIPRTIMVWFVTP